MVLARNSWGGQNHDHVGWPVHRDESSQQNDWTTALLQAEITTFSHADVMLSGAHVME